MKDNLRVRWNAETLGGVETAQPAWEFRGAWKIHSQTWYSGKLRWSKPLPQDAKYSDLRNSSKTKRDCPSRRSGVFFLLRCGIVPTLGAKVQRLPCRLDTPRITNTSSSRRVSELLG